MYILQCVAALGHMREMGQHGITGCGVETPAHGRTDQGSDDFFEIGRCRHAPRHSLLQKDMTFGNQSPIDAVCHCYDALFLRAEMIAYGRWIGIGFAGTRLTVTSSDAATSQSTCSHASRSFSAVGLAVESIASHAISKFER